MSLATQRVLRPSESSSHLQGVGFFQLQKYSKTIFINAPARGSKLEIFEL